MAMTKDKVNREIFEKSHELGVQRHPHLWISANDAAVDAVRIIGGDPADLQTKAMVSAVVLRVLDRLKVSGVLKGYEIVAGAER